jgi:transcriptional regulator with XRE-family HTH domain
MLYNNIKGGDYMNLSENIGNRIKDLRSKTNMSQEELSNVLNVSQETVSEWEDGISSPNLEQVIELSNHFKMTVDNLLAIDNKTVISELDVYQLLENENLIFDITSINIREDMSISITVENKISQMIYLNPDNFLLIDVEGNIIRPKSYPITRNPYDFTLPQPSHILPPFIPPFSKVNIILNFEKPVDRDLKLWINIENIIEKAVFIIKVPLINQQILNQDISNIDNNERIYYFNYLYRYNMLTNNGSERNPKINLEIIPFLNFSIDFEFISKHPSVFDRETIKQLIIDGEYFDINFIRMAFDLNNQRVAIKNNFDLIEKLLKENKSSAFLHVEKDEEFLDEEIIEKMILWNIIYAKNVKEWHYNYIDDTFYKKHKDIIRSLSFTNSLNLFRSKISDEIINSIILDIEPIDIPLHKIVKLDKYYPGRIFQETIDKLVLKYNISNIDDIESVKNSVTAELYNALMDIYSNKK